MKFGASTFIWVSPFSDDTLDLFHKVQHMGFDMLEICVESPETINVHSIAAASAMTGIGIIICGVFGAGRDISSVDPAVRTAGVEYLKTCVDIAAGVGAEVVSGPMYSATGKTNLLSPEEKTAQWNFAVENMKIVAEYAKQKDIKLAVEPLNRFETDFINTVEQGMELLERIGFDNVGLLLDTFHMNIEEENIRDAICKAGDRLFSFHACANDRGTPGRDHIDWVPIKRAFRKIGYDKYMVIEAFNTDITEIARAVSLWREPVDPPDLLAIKGLKFLKRVFQFRK